MEKILKVVLIVFLSCAQYGLCATQSELSDIERQAEEKEEQLKKLREQQSALEKELQKLTKKEKNAQMQSTRLSADIEVFKTQSGRAQTHREIMEDSLPLWRNILRAEISNYIIEDILSSPGFDAGETMKLAAFGALIKTHMLFLQKLGEEVEKTAGDLQTLKEKRERLLLRQNELEAQKQNIQKDYLKKKENLADARQSAAAAEKNLKELKESAKQMKAVFKKAEEKRKAEARKTGARSVSAAASGIKNNSLMWPLRGKVINKFGKEYNERLKTWIFRDGIKISAQAGTPVEAVKDGKVIYAGPFRSYGNVVILDHGGGFFTIYGFLSDIKVGQEQELGAGQILGLSGADTQGNAMSSGEDALYFEVRIGTSAEDPQKWLEDK
ncbi:MAG: peptidoglycan DD-metalloendopeptidase family protein [Elusimicrobiota bacterium]|nr:peptidoglycan DD-metalloendopeptidase family protein [Elusimicrobiota bacterium]